jgi:formate dehydrogenase iron-sulfur subunit
VDGVRHAFGPVTPADVRAHPRRAPCSRWARSNDPLLRRQTRLTFARVGVIDPLDLADYEAHGGLAGLRRALAMTGPGHRGRGQGQRPARPRRRGLPHRHQVGDRPDSRGDRKYIVCNADEGDSGTFADRMLMEGDPFTLIEGMAIAGLATGATKGFVYIRSEYPDAIAVMTRAVAHRPRAGCSGRTSSARAAFDIEIRVGAGAYVCGEETSLLNSLEGKRGVVRAKPPLPALEGLFGSRRSSTT